MSRHLLMRGVSAGVFTLLASANIASAQQSLPTIDVGAGQRRAAGPSVTAARPAPAPVSSPVLAPAPQPVSRWSPTLPDGKPAFVQRWQLPNTVASVTRKDIQEKINIVDSQDALKYTPSIFVRKLRGGNEGMVQTRTWGLASARSMVFVDDLLISQLISNGHTDGQPRWGLISPEEIERVDVLYGPYAAQYAGNSIGGVIKYTTRMPEKLEITAKQTVAVQDFGWWGTQLTLPTTNTALTIGDKIGNLSYFVALNYSWNNNQPISFINNGVTNRLPNYSAGGILSFNAYGIPQYIVGSGAISEENIINGKVKLAYDITPDIRATYTLGVFNSDRVSEPRNYSGGGAIAFPSTLVLPAPAFNPFATLQSFGSSNLRYQETIVTNALAIRSDTRGPFDFELSASHFTYPYSSQRSPWSAVPSTAAVPFGGYTATGRDTIFTGTYWTLLDLKGIYRPQGPGGMHDISFGLHGDQYHSNNPVWLTTNWTAGQQSSLGAAQSIASGTTRTYALWAQDAIKLRPDLKLTLGIRGETWKATDGYNQTIGTLNSTGNGIVFPAVSQAPLPSRPMTPAEQADYIRRTTSPNFQPNRASTRFSPKASLQWNADDKWTITGNIGMANRFPTVRELYNLSVTPGASGFAVSPSPYLKPESALTKEIAIERKLGPDGFARLTLFDEEVRDAIVSNATFVPGTTFQTNANINVERVRNSGAEVAWTKNHFLFKGLEFFGSATWVNSRVISFPGFIRSLGDLTNASGNFEQAIFSVSGKNVPGVPKFRWNAGLTYRPDDNWAFTVAARWQDRIWRTLANNDVAHGFFGASDRFFLVDLHAHYKMDDHWSFDAGIDNVNNYKFALFHPFPQRTYVFSAKYEYGTGKGENGIFYSGHANGLPSSWFQPAAWSID